MLMVQKFGGSSLKDGDCIHAAVRRIAGALDQGNQVVAVVSAQGDTTDALIARSKAVNSCPSAREMDAYLAAGEQISAGLLAMALEKQGIPGVSLTGMQAGLMTDEIHGNAQVTGLKPDRLRKLLEQGCVPVVAGFQGVGPNGDVTTLGRGGSDTTAVALAAFLGAEQCLIYTDVDGIYDRDPRVFADAVRFERISYGDMLKLIKNGARVLHDRSVKLAWQYGVKIRVLSTFRPGPGTVVEQIK